MTQARDSGESQAARARESGRVCEGRAACEGGPHCGTAPTCPVIAARIRAHKPCETRKLSWSARRLGPESTIRVCAGLCSKKPATRQALQVLDLVARVAGPKRGDPRACGVAGRQWSLKRGLGCSLNSKTSKVNWNPTSQDKKWISILLCKKKFKLPHYS